MPSHSKETKLGNNDQGTSPSAGKNTSVVLVPCSRMELRPYSYFRWCGYFWGPWVSFVTTDEFSVTVSNITSRIGVSWTHNLPFYFLTYLNIMAILSKASKPDNFESHDSLKFSFKNIWDLCLNFVDCESFLEWNSPDILTLCETKPGWLNCFWQFLWEKLSFFNLKRF